MLGQRVMKWTCERIFQTAVRVAAKSSRFPLSYGSPYLYAPYIGFHLECTEPVILDLERDDIANDLVHVGYTKYIILDLRRDLIMHQHGHDFAFNWYEQELAKLGLRGPGLDDEFIPDLKYIRQLLARCGIKTWWPADLCDPDFHKDDERGF